MNRRIAGSVKEPSNDKDKAEDPVSREVGKLGATVKRGKT